MVQAAPMPHTLYTFLQAAFVDIRTNGMVTAILPQLVQFTLNAVSDQQCVAL